MSKGNVHQLRPKTRRQAFARVVNGPADLMGTADEQATWALIESAVQSESDRHAVELFVRQVFALAEADGVDLAAIGRGRGA